LFDFTLPSPTPYVADPFTPVPARFTQSRKRALVWATSALSGALLIWGGLSLYQERKDTDALALVASEAKQAARTDTPFEVRALAATAPARPPGPDAPVQQAAPASTPPPDLPPLVMLEPDPPPVVKPTPPAPKAARAVAQRPATPAPKPSVRKTREPASAPTRPARDKPKREPVRQLAQASAITVDKHSEPDTSLAATLRACREHGYHATQCIKRQCAVGKYGFACRGR
jgi:outer membrane biosynthesis protein TonB